MNYESIQRLLDCNLCLSCFSHYLDVKIETIAVSVEDDLLSECCRSMSRLLLHHRSGIPSEDARRTANQSFQAKLRSKYERVKHDFNYCSDSEKNPFIDIDKGEICPNCLNVLHPVVLDRLMRDIRAQVDDMLPTSCNTIGNKEETIPVQLHFTIPAIFDVSRVPTRTFITANVEKVVNFSTFDIILSQILSILLPIRYRIEVVADAKVIVAVKPNVQDQLTMTHAVYPDFKFKKPKRKFGSANHNVPSSSNCTSSLTGDAADSKGDEVEEDDIPRMNIDKVLLWMKSISKQGIIEMYDRLINYLSKWQLQHGNNKQPLMTFSTDCYYAPIYLFGRYCKYARDVPQSPWTVTVEPNSTGNNKAVSGNSNSDDMVGDEEVRKGRGSIEEIIAYEIKRYSYAKIVKLHACGREDIDVRCVGNGRPFALEVGYARKAFTKSILQQIAININSFQGMNTQGDIRIIGDQIIAVDRLIWESMQSEAEEKKKGYSCVVYVKEGNVTKERLQELEERSRDGQDIDEEGQVCLQIMQRTPLRVMHRRSLIDRTRFLYEIKTCMINEHYFLMNLVTSAGAYVKEFVHGDMGRTRPSISSWFNSPAEILQLDVTWLYDDFQKYSTSSSGTNAGAEDYEQDMLNINVAAKDVIQDEREKQESWEWLKSRRLAKISKKR